MRVKLRIGGNIVMTICMKPLSPENPAGEYQFQILLLKKYYMFIPGYKFPRPIFNGEINYPNSCAHINYSNSCAHFKQHVVENIFTPEDKVAHEGSM